MLYSLYLHLTNLNIQTLMVDMWILPAAKSVRAGDEVMNLMHCSET